MHGSNINKNFDVRNINGTQLMLQNNAIHYAADDHVDVCCQ